MASIYDKASLVMIPSGSKEGKLYSQKPTNGDGDFTFSRSTAATRVNASGNIEKETQNLLIQSNGFDSGVWVNDDTTETGGQTGYNGSSDAWKLVGNTNASRHYIVQSISKSGVNTWSLYAKASGHNYVQFGSGSTTNQYVNFDLSDGSIGNIGSDFFSAIAENIGSGWYRLSVVDKSSTNGFYISLVSSKTAGWLESWSMSNDTDGILIQDAQLNQGLIAQEVITTTTTAIYGGITDNVPRLDYTDSSCPALLLEPLRTNRVTNSEYLNGDWSEFRSILIVNDDTSPEGVDNATKLQEDTTASNTHFTGKGYNYVSGTTYSWSVYAKADGRDEIAIQQGNPAVISFNAVFNFTSETATNFGNGTARIEDAGNGWYRCIIEGTTALLSSGTNINLFLRSGNSTTYTGDGTSGVLLYGFQLEEGSYATSYIPTYGSAVTRNDDVCRKENATDLIGQTEGSFFMEFEMDLNNTIGTPVCISEYASTSNFILVYQLQANSLSFRIRVNSVDQLNITSSTLSEGKHKFAFAYKENNCVFYIDGVLIGTSTSNTIPSNLNRLSLVDVGSGINKVDSAVNQTLLFKTRLTNEELAALTTI